MFLKRLETIGFKSFADRVTMEFVDGITTIVGPNGSGKSNIIDAIRWVLGEQSVRSLRGQRMEDVIFQGSDTRNPLNFAEVSLVLNNENNQLNIDYQEVKVTRRVYRSGESEFLINKQACRLKDIVELFTDTGLGRESFSIIGQGKIDEILSSKADERRAVFEEAAGVMRYKRRKEQATYKLTETENNLSRVEDIIYELKQQITPLREQAATAKRFKQLQAELTEKQISLLVTEIEQLNMEWRNLLAKIEAEKLVHVEQQTKVQRAEAQIIDKQAQVEDMEGRISSLQKYLLSLTEQLEQTEGKRNVLIEQRKHRNENKQQLEAEKITLQREYENTAKKIEKERTSLNLVKEQLTELQAEMKEIEAKLFTRHDELSDEIEELKADYIEALNEKAVLKNESQALRKRQSQVEKSLTHHEYTHRDLTKDARRVSSAQERAEAELDRIIKEIREEEERLMSIEKKLETRTKLFDQKQREWYSVNDQMTKLKSRKETLEEMKKNFQGFAYGAKEILQAHKRGALQDIIGPVIDLITVPSQYMVAIDTVLGGQAQHIVVQNDQAARFAIAWLKRENKGRATFLPLQSILARHLPSALRSNIENEVGFVGIASQLVSVDPAYQRLIDHLMGNVIVTESLRDANNIAAKTNRRYRIVTLEGDVVFPGGSISGGAQRKRAASLFGREKELNQLTVQIGREEAKRTQMKQELVILQEELLHLQKSVEKKSKKLSEKKQSEQELMSEAREYAIKNESLTDQLTAYQYQENEYIEEKKGIGLTLKETEQSLIEIDQRIVKLEATIEEKTSEQESLLSDKRMNEEALHALQLKNAEQQERFKNYEARLASFNDAQTITKEKISKIRYRLDKISKEEAETETVATVEDQIDKYRQERQEITSELEGQQAERQSLVQTIEDDRRELKAAQKLYEQHASALQNKEIEANRLDVVLENHLQTLQNKYSITYEKASQSYDKVTDTAYVTEEVVQLKSEIRALGTVNLGAIDEFERIQQRESFLNEQRDDLIEAKTTLYDAIQKMDEEMITRFKTSFETIQAAFTDVFKQLFGGGHAELVLTDPEDYLATGIDIVARPPGKKLKTLELLSGGERALTAIALLFAILQARPVPFVILDEVDAALDEANVERFALYLKSFSKESQFVVISHRKGTMEEADALYGVTMQESGVSRFVSVRLEEADDLVSTR